jgi:alpha-methylacyl-CoA racemase
VTTGPLSGLKVLEIAGIGPGPFCGMLLADLGADVVRVERPGGGGMTLVPRAEDLLNRGKRSVAVDLGRFGGAETVLSLVEHADVMFEGFRPGVAERLGIGPVPCLARRRQLVYGRMTGWGQDGPLASTAGHDITYIAPTGALHAIGQAGGPPQIPLNLLGDFAGGSLYLLVGMLAALDEARRSGQGQVVDAAIVDGTSHLMTMIYNVYAAGGWSDDVERTSATGGRPSTVCTRPRTGSTWPSARSSRSSTQSS